MLAEQTGEPPLDAAGAVATRDELLDAIAAARTVFVEESVNRYVVAVLRHTRSNSHLALGASPRSGIALLRLAKARALVERRDIRHAGRRPGDGRAGASHRLMLAPTARSSGLGPADIVREALEGHAGTRVRRRSSGQPARRTGARVRSSSRGVRRDAGRRRRRRPRRRRHLARLWARAAERTSPSSAACSPASGRRRRSRGRDQGAAPSRLPARRPSRCGSARPAREARAADAALAKGHRLAEAPRGRYVLEPLDVSLEDPLGLERVSSAGRRGGERAHPTSDPDARRRVLGTARVIPAAPGHCCVGRAVSRSTLSGSTCPGSRCGPCTGRAPRGAARLMVKELDDAPRDDLAIVLDQDPGGVAGRPGRRASMRRFARRGRSPWRTCRGTAASSSWARRRDRGGAHPRRRARLGAGAGRARDGRARRRRPRRPHAALAVNGDHARAGDRRRDRRPDRAVEPLLELRRGGRAVSLVIMASETYAGRPRDPQQPPRSALRRRACWWPSSRRRPRSPRRSAGAAQERPVASVVSGFGRRLLAASVPVAAVAYAWASIETGRACACSPGSRRGCARRDSGQAVVRVVVAVATLVGLTLIAVGHSVGAVRDVVDQGLRDIYAVAPPFVPKTHPELHALVILTACAFCLAIAVTAGSRPFLAAAIVAGWDRLARNDPAGPEHDRDGGAGAARRALADRDQRAARSPRSRARRSGEPGHRDRGRDAGRGRCAALASPRSTGRTGICSARAGRGTPSWPCGAPTTAASSFRPARPPCSRSRRPGGPCTGVRRRWTPSPRITGSRRSTRPDGADLEPHAATRSLASRRRAFTRRTG